MNRVRSILGLLLAVVWLGGDPTPARGASVGTTFTYQGSLTDTGAPASGTYDLQFTLYDAVTGGNDFYQVVTKDDVTVANGLFTAELDFGTDAMDGDAWWMEIGVRPGAQTGAFTTLVPRQEITAVPYALSLAPGATIHGTDSSVILIVDNDGTGTGMLGRSRGTGVQQAGVYGATLGTATGVFGESTRGYGVVGYGQQSHAFYVYGAGEAGLHVETAGTHGVDVALAGQDGIRVQSAGWSGVYVENAGSDALRVQAAGQDGLRLFDGVTRDYIRAGGDADLKFRVSNSGTAYADGGFQGAADFAELMRVTGDSSRYSPGDVLAISPDRDRAVTLSSSANSTKVIGVYSTRPGFIGSPHTTSDRRADEVPVAVVGIVPCKATTENGAISRGDLLVTSSTPGHAMRAGDRPALGSILGKALSPLERGSGQITAMITLH